MENIILFSEGIIKTLSIFWLPILLYIDVKRHHRLWELETTEEFLIRERRILEEKELERSRKSDLNILLKELGVYFSK